MTELFIRETWPCAPGPPPSLLLLLNPCVFPLPYMHVCRVLHTGGMAAQYGGHGYADRQELHNSVGIVRLRTAASFSHAAVAAFQQPSGEGGGVPHLCGNLPNDPEAGSDLTALYQVPSYG